ncbi:MAG: hypothetical protein WC070_05055 [Candidatus Magasanikbacteria bacterium]
MEENKKRFFKLDIFFWLFLLAVAGYFFLKSAPQATAPDDESMVTSTSEVSADLPEGVTVENLGDGNKLVKNEKNDYTLKVNDDIYLYKDFEGDLRVQNYEQPKEAYGGSPGCSVSITLFPIKTQEELRIEEENNCKNIIGFDCKSVHVEQLKYNNIDWIKIYSHGTYVGTDNPLIVTNREDSMIGLYFSCSNKNFVDNILNNFSF